MRSILKQSKRGYATIFVKRRRACLGGTLVEFAICASFVMMLTLAIIQYCVLVFDINALNHIAREAARYAAVHGAESTACDVVTDPVSIRAEISNLCAHSPLNYNNIENTTPSTTPYLITYNWASTTSGTDPSSTNPVGAGTAFGYVTISIKYNMAKAVFFEPFVPGLSSWGNMTVQASSIIDVAGQTQ